MCVAKYCLNRKNDIAFLDPELVNEKTCGGMHGNKVEDLTVTLVVIFKAFKMNNKTEILIAYNYNNVFSVLIFMLLFLVTIIR
jgi:hypothetical protein